MAWGLPTDPVTLAVVAVVAVFSVVNWLRWRSKAAWLERVQLEQFAEELDRDDDDDR